MGWIWTSVVIVTVLAVSNCPAASTPAPISKEAAMAQPERHDIVKDHLWIWAHDAAFYGSGSGLPEVAHITPIEGAFFMGIPNVMFIRYQGIPEPPFEQYTVPFRSLRSFEWSLLNNSNEMSHLGNEQEHVYRLAAKRPNMTGVVMDDFIMRPGGEATAGPWLADNNPRFPVVLSLTLPEPCRVTSIELTQTSWPSGDYRTGRFEVEASSDGSLWKQVFKGEMPNTPGARVSIPLGDMMLSSVRISVLSTHDKSGSLSCGLGSVRLLDGDSPVPVHDAIVSATSEFPTHESICLTLEPGEKRTILPKLMLTPEELGKARKRLDNIDGRRLDLSVVVYTHQMEASLAQVLDACDVILLWTWRPEDIKNMPENLAKARRLFPGKRIRLGCYMWDFSVGKPLSMELMKWQCDFALRSLRAGEIEGIIFLGTNICDLGIDTVEWTREWVLRVGETPLEDW